MTQDFLVKNYMQLANQLIDRNASSALLLNLKNMILNDSKLNSDSKKKLCDFINNYL